MKLHNSVVEKLIQIYENFGGFQDNSKLVRAINQLDLTPYERKTTQNQEVVLVLTEEYVRALSKK